MIEFTKGAFLGLLAFTFPLCIYVVSTGGL